ncbi:MAG TPA: amino acid ABC transporter substrate-binding protein [Xanthobacteraceae bacterium]|nr:amino acid ABC transporter substrate-binding protein [Xanthobacteraceae bacterium]
MTALSRFILRSLIVAATLLCAGPLWAQQPPLKIGFGMALSGGLAGGGKAALLTYQIWQEEINKRGGLLGRKVELVYYDDQSNPATVPGIYSKLLDIDKVDVIISGYGTVPVVAAMPVVMGRKKTFLAYYALDANAKFKYDRYFTMQPSGPDPQSEFSIGFFELAAKLNPKPQTVAIVGADAEYGQIAMAGAREHAKKKGFKIVYDQSYPPATVDFTSIVRTIKVANPDLVFIASYPPDTAGMLRAIYEVGLSAKVLGGGMVGLQYAALKQQFGYQLNNVVCYDYYAPEPTMKFPGVDEVLAKYRARAAEAGVDVLGLYIPPFAYAQMQILEETAKAVNGFDDAKMAEYLHKTTFKTVVGDIKFGKYGEWETPRILLVQYQNIKGNDVNQFKDAGKQVIVYPPRFKSGELKVPFTPTKQ